MNRIPIFWRFLFAFVVLAVVATILSSIGNRGASKPRLERAKRDSIDLFAKLPLPEGTREREARTQTPLELKRSRAIVVEQLFERDGPFASTDAFYRSALTGWKEIGRSSVGTEYCKAPYTLAVERDSWTDTTHQFRLRLTYDDSHGGDWECR